MDEQEFYELAQKADIEKRPCIAIFQDTDGNWRGVMKSKYDHSVFSRAISPETVLQELLTHDGK